MVPITRTDLNEPERATLLEIHMSATATASAPKRKAKAKTASKKSTEEAKKKAVTVAAPKLETVTLRIQGTAPYMQNKFSAKARQIMEDAQKAGSTAKSKKKRDPKDFTELFEQAQHIAHDGWNGIPCAAFRASMIAACKLVGVVMARAKLAIFIEADGFDADDGTPLVRMLGDPPREHHGHVRNASGVADIRSRPMWDPGWQANVRVKFDTDMFELDDVVNLLMRAGLQVGIGEGRHDSKNSYGQGFGTFEIVEEA